LLDVASSQTAVTTILQEHAVVHIFLNVIMFALGNLTLLDVASSQTAATTMLQEHAVVRIYLETSLPTASYLWVSNHF
jgi:hypothetical protein